MLRLSAVLWGGVAHGATPSMFYAPATGPVFRQAAVSLAESVSSTCAHQQPTRPFDLSASSGSGQLFSNLIKTLYQPGFRCFSTKTSKMPVRVFFDMTADGQPVGRITMEVREIV